VQFSACVGGAAGAARAAAIVLDAYRPNAARAASSYRVADSLEVAGVDSADCASAVALTFRRAARERGRLSSARGASRATRAAAASGQT